MPDSDNSASIRRLRTRLAALRTTVIASEVGRRLALTAAVALAAFVAVVTIDHSAEFPLDTRRTLLFTLSAIALLGVVWAAAAFFTARRDDEALALLVERHDPSLASRLIATLQFADGKAAVPSGDSQPFIDALTDETTDALADRSTVAATETKKLSTALKAGWIVTLAAALAYLFGYPASESLVRRAFLADIPVPRETAITATPAETTVGIGDPLTLTFKATGELPDEGEARLSLDGGRTLTKPLVPSENAAGTYTAALDAVPASFTLTARINDADAAPVRITALPRPEITSFSARQTYPDFTQLPPTDHTPGDLALFPGATVEITVETTKPLATASLDLLAPAASTALDTKIDGQNLTATFTVPADNLTGVRVAATDSDGLGFRDTPVYRATVIADLPPAVRVLEPVRIETLATRRAVLPVHVIAEDRYGIAGLELHFKNDTRTGSVELKPETLGTTVDHRFELDLGALPVDLNEGDSLEFWIVASDPNPTVAAGESRHYTARIVSAADKRAELLARVADSLGRIGDVANGQESLNAALGKLLRETEIPLTEPPTDEETDQ